MVHASVKVVLSWIANVPVQEIQATTLIKDDLQMDSLDFVLSVARLERLFNITFSNEDLEKLETVGDLCQYVVAQTKLAA